MGDLAQLTAAGRSDIFEGFTLSPLSLRDFGELELAVEARVVAVAQVTAEGQPREVAQFLLLNAQDDITRGKYAFGKPGFNAMVMSGKMAGHLFHLSLRHAHPDINRAQADALADHPKAEAARTAIAELSGYSRTEDGGAGSVRPIDWAGLYKSLEKLGVPITQAGNMTLAQLQTKLGIKSPLREPPAKSDEQKTGERAAAFDTICAKHGLTPAALAQEPTARLVELLKAEGYGMVSESWIPQWVNEYVMQRAA